MRRLFEYLFGCSHERTTFPMRRRQPSPEALEQGTYVVCLDCGKEFEYLWDAMRRSKGASIGK
jgi:hypothetical protein